MAKKKFSYADRVKYHKSIIGKFVDLFRTSKNGCINLDFDKMESAEKRNPKIQYSSGFCTFVNDIQRGYEMPETDLKKKSKNFQRGFLAAKKAREKSMNIKF